jgi:hypothetical protein
MDAIDRNRLMRCVGNFPQASVFNGWVDRWVNSRVITGNEEALFGWLAASYLRDRIDDGYVEMGGVSAQIAFPVIEGALEPGVVPAAPEVVQVTIAPLINFGMFFGVVHCGDGRGPQAIQSTPG